MIRKSNDPTPRRELLSDDDPAPFEVINREGGFGMLLVCDHASREVPRSLARLGLPDEAFEHHIAWDIGADGVAKGLAEALDAPLVRAGFSRLVIDANRPIGHPGSIVEEADGWQVPGNRDLTQEARRRRVREVFEAYHDAINRAIGRMWDSGRPPAMVSVHSFSPRFGDRPRPWDIGVLWKHDPRIAVPLMEELEALGFNVGDNEPYSGHDLAYTCDMHGTAAGLANCAVEINQDLITDAEGQARWVAALAEILRNIADIPGLYRVERF